MPIQTRCLAADWTCLVRLLPLPMSIKQHMLTIIWLHILTDEKDLNIASRENLTNGIGREGREFPKGRKAFYHLLKVTRQLDQHTQELGRSMRWLLTPFGTHPDCSSWIGFPVALPKPSWTLSTIIALWGEFAIALVRKVPLRVGILLRLSISGHVGEEVRAGLICFINRMGNSIAILFKYTLLLRHFQSIRKWFIGITKNFHLVAIFLGSSCPFFLFYG